MPDEDLNFDIGENDKAVGFLKAKTVVSPEAYGQLPLTLRIRAFTAAGLDNLETLGRIRDAVASVPAGGDWKTAKKTIAAEIGGDEEGAKARAELILRINALQAFAVGRHAEQMDSLDAFPFWMYRTSKDERVRSSHAALDGVILPATDPWWKTHYPPWEFGCRCMIIRLTRGQAAALGVSDVRKLPGKPPDSGFRFDPSDLRIDLDSVLSGLDPLERRMLLAVFGQQTIELDDSRAATLAEANFVPAKTFAEAIKFTRDYIAPTLKIPKTFQDLELMNRVNAAVAARMREYALPKMKAFEVDNKGKTIAFVRVWGNGDLSFGISPKRLKDPATLFENNVRKPQAKGEVRWLGASSEANMFRHIIDHEFGHALWERAKTQELSDRLRSVFYKSLNNGDTKKVSEYSETNHKEFFAESFAIYVRGEELPESITAVIKEVLNDTRS